MGTVRILKASAGSGKTYQLAYEFIRDIIREPYTYRNILAVTFTNKATEEMKHRIVKEINDIANGISTSYMDLLVRDLGLNPGRIAGKARLARTLILHDYSHFSILTIDKFFQRIIRSFIRELGIDLNFNLELQTDSLLSRAADAVIDQMGSDKELREWITAFVKEKIDENRSWDLKTGLMKLGSEIFGERFKRLSGEMIPAADLAAVMDSATAEYQAVKAKLKADAAKICNIVSDAGLAPEDFAYGANGFMSYVNCIARGELKPYGARVVKALGSAEGWCSSKSPNRSAVDAVAPNLLPLLRGICDTYDRNVVFLNSVELLRSNYRNFALLSDLAEKVAAICAAENIMPISETNNILYKLVGDNDTPFIFEKTGNYYDKFMIDEFQDTSSMQWENFVPLLHNAVSQSEQEPVLLVGDIKQSIYRWRGGDWRIMARGIEREFGRISTAGLTTNYRSSRNVIEFNNSIISEATESDNSSLNDMLSEAESAGAIEAADAVNLRDMLANAYVGHEQIPAKQEDKGYVNITFYSKDEEGELLPPVVGKIEELQKRGYRAGDIAVLVRFNSDAAEIASMLLEHKRQNPGSDFVYDVVTQEALTIGVSPVIGFIMACLRLSLDPENRTQWEVFDMYAAGLDHGSNDHGSENREVDTTFLASLGLKPLTEAIEEVIQKYGLNTKPENTAYLQAFQDQAISFSTSRISDISLFVKWWTETGCRQSVYIPGGTDAITVMTIHKAKGLQFPAVIIPYADWNLNPSSRTLVWARDRQGKFSGRIGAVPIGFSEKMKNSVFAADYFNELVLSHIDNINLFYVAITRAMDELHIMVPELPKSASQRINAMIAGSIKAGGDGMVTVGSMKGAAHDNGPYCEFSFGSPVCKAPQQHAVSSGGVVVDPAYISYPVSGRLRLKIEPSKFRDDGEEPANLLPRDYGILLHGLFERSATLEEIEANLVRMFDDRIISQDELGSLRPVIAEAIAHPLAASWFSGDWDEVRSESGILMPAGDVSRRPDRVMIKGSHAVVVDYKFGLNRRPSYSRQVGRYTGILREMGYETVEGYVWYVSLNDIVPV